MVKPKQPASPIYNWAIPASLGVPPDPLRLRLDFHNNAVVMTGFAEGSMTTRLVSAMDIAHSLAKELSYGTGILPENALWWINTSDGPIVAVYNPPQTRILALQDAADKPPRRFKLPLPGFIFLCPPGRPPYVFAVKSRPQASDMVYKAPLCNVFESGATCPGSNRYPTEPGDIIESFFRSFFTSHADLNNRSVKYPASIVKLWEELDGAETFPLDDMVPQLSVKDLLQMRKLE